MDIEQGLKGCKAAWEARDDVRFAALFAEHARYHDTALAVPVGHTRLREH